DLAMESSGDMWLGMNPFGSGFVGVLDEVQAYKVAIPATNGLGDNCSDNPDTNPSITRDMKCAMAATITAPVLKIGSGGLRVGGQAARGGSKQQDGITQE